jgi:hypothetical protein
MAKGVPVAKRIEFLGQIEECLPGKKPTPPPDVDDVEELLQDVEALVISGYPVMQDVIDSKAGEMKGLDRFWPEWEKVLSKMTPADRVAELRLEAINRVKGIDGIVKLARSWKGKQPRGYLFWLDRLKEGNNLKGVVTVSLEALKVLDKGRFRERVAECLTEAAQALGNNKRILQGRRERFFSNLCDQNLLDLLAEAINKRKKNLMKPC